MTGVIGKIDALARLRLRSKPAYRKSAYQFCQQSKCVSSRFAKGSQMLPIGERQPFGVDIAGRGGRYDCQRDTTQVIGANNTRTLNRCRCEEKYKGSPKNSRYSPTNLALINVRILNSAQVLTCPTDSDLSDRSNCSNLLANMRMFETALDCRPRLSPLRAWMLILMVALTSLTGCIRKRMTIRSTPSGATAYIDKQPIGMTPVSTNYTYYGTRSIELTRPGFRTEKFLRKFNPPWYAIPPLDFFSETLWPFEKRDERIIDVQLTPEQEVPEEALIASGEQLRLQASQGVAVTPPPTIGTPAPILNQPTINNSNQFAPSNPNLPILGPVTMQ